MVLPAIANCIVMQDASLYGICHYSTTQAVIQYTYIYRKIEKRWYTFRNSRMAILPSVLSWGSMIMRWTGSVNSGEVKTIEINIRIE